MKKNFEQRVDLEDLIFQRNTEKEQTQLIKTEAKKTKILNTRSSDQSQKRKDPSKVHPEF